jgi:transglutaminase-like putative cysteine protease
MKSIAAFLSSLVLLAGCQSKSNEPLPAGNAATAAPAIPAGKPVLDSSLPYQASRSNPITYEVDFFAVVTAPYKSKVLKVWLPLPQTDAGQEVTEGELSTFPMKVEPKIGTEPVFGNKFAYFEFHSTEGGQIIRHKFKVKVWELRWNLDPAKVVAVSDWPASFDRYRKGESQAVVIDDRFDKLIAEVVPQRGNPLTDMSNVMDWVIKDFKYQHGEAASLRASSVNAIERHAGHCSDYHGFCSAMGRVLGTPTRVTYGMNPFPKNSPSHCKMEAFLPPYGWVSFDVSETQNLMNLINTSTELDAAAKQRLVQLAKTRLLTGYRDNTWFLQTRGTDYDLEPKAAQRVPVVRTIYAEADGIAIPDVDAADENRREFTWMTVQSFKPDKPVSYPFKDYKSLEPK